MEKKSICFIGSIFDFFVVRDWTACQGMCWSTQQLNSSVIFWLIVIFTGIFLYYSLTLWVGYKKKYIEKKKDAEKK